ncbi:phosphotransferase [Streptomyces sp. RKAG290]|uniref:phosphotransferase family protein n=1 Tax=Streptomyces sp. RKAG290 TaxID=2888348 RepID=UPI00203461C7|nr:phosphotransferase [Streptomyces sp. RKAG290]MCM2415580.1 phosphotransferase [Streptomyces sp. RKAG290]
MPPPSPSPSGRLQWADVPPPLRARLETTLGAPVTEAVTPSGGFGHQLAAALRLAGGRRVFVKAAPDDDPLTVANLHEAAALDALPPYAPAPDLLGIHRTAGWTAVVIAHLDGPDPDLSPASGDVEQTWALLDSLTAAPAPASYVAAVSAAPSAAGLLHGWKELRDDPPDDLAPAARSHLPQLAELEAAWPALATGDRVVHGDLRADNMVRDHDRGVTFVDWAHATTGPACVDAASLAPQLVLAGHAPQTSPACSWTTPPPPAALTPPPHSSRHSPATGTATPAGPPHPAPPDCATTNTARQQPDSPSWTTA